MDYTHTEAHQMAYDFSVYLHEKMKKFPHYEKFTLQKDIRESIDGILDEIEMLENTKTASHLYAADRYILIEETQEKIKRNQEKEGDGLKTGQKLPPFPFIIFIKERW